MGDDTMEPMSPLERRVSKLSNALREIANRAGSPTMDYSPGIERGEQRASLDWIAVKAADALNRS